MLSDQTLIAVNTILYKPSTKSFHKIVSKSLTVYIQSGSLIMNQAEGPDKYI